MESPANLAEIFERILELQVHWDQRLTTPAMQERGQLIRNQSEPLLERIAKSVPGLSFEPEVGGSNGAGSANRVPWIRVFSKSHAPQATSGWYLAYLIAADGSAVYLSLMQGVTEFSAAERQRVTAGLIAASDQARQLLGRIDESKVSTDIALYDAGKRGARYEQATVYAIRYGVGEIPPDSTLSSDLEYMLGLLDRLYRREDETDRKAPNVKKELTAFDSDDDYSWEQLQADTLWDEASLREIVDTFRASSKQIVLAGPLEPGKRISRWRWPTT